VTGVPDSLLALTHASSLAAAVANSRFLSRRYLHSLDQSHILDFVTYS